MWSPRETACKDAASLNIYTLNKGTVQRFCSYEALFEDKQAIGYPAHQIFMTWLHTCWQTNSVYSKTSTRHCYLSSIYLLMVELLTVISLCECSNTLFEVASQNPISKKVHQILLTMMMEYCVDFQIKTIRYRQTVADQAAPRSDLKVMHCKLGSFRKIIRFNSPVRQQKQTRVNA